MLAHYYNVPVVLVSGSEELEDEVKESLPEAVFHATNKTFALFSTQSLHGAVTALPEKFIKRYRSFKIQGICLFQNL